MSFRNAAVYESECSSKMIQWQHASSFSHLIYLLTCLHVIQNVRNYEWYVTISNANAVANMCSKILAAPCSYSLADRVDRKLIWKITEVVNC